MGIMEPSRPRRYARFPNLPPLPRRGLRCRLGLHKIATGRLISEMNHRVCIEYCHRCHLPIGNIWSERWKR